jgi:hypothetical protein
MEVTYFRQFEYCKQRSSSLWYTDCLVTSKSRVTRPEGRTSAVSIKSYSMPNATHMRPATTDQITWGQHPCTIEYNKNAAQTDCTGRSARVIQLVLGYQVVRSVPWIPRDFCRTEAPFSAVFLSKQSSP